MALVYWNVRGLGTLEKRRLVKDTITTSKCMIACLQETKVNNVTDRFLSSVCGSHLSIRSMVAPIRSFGGLLTCWNPWFIGGSTKQQGEFSLSTIHHLIASPSTEWMLMNVYGTMSENLNDEFLTELYQIRNS